MYAAQLFLDCGLQMRQALLTDADSARSIAGRHGLGKTRHIQVRYLWLQERLLHKFLSIDRVPGNLNVGFMRLATRPVNNGSITNN